MRWVLPVVLVTLMITAAATIVARQLYASPTDTDPAMVVAGDRTVPPGEQPGDSTVLATKDASNHPLYPAVHQILQTYFDAINAKRYDRWRTVVTQRRANNEVEGTWRAAYRSTRDGTIVVQRIELGPPDTARVLLSFTSTQDVASAPQELPERCIHWRVVLPLALQNGAWKLDSGPTNQSSQHEKC